ncbi:transposase [Streptomyces phaeochromogenes]|uniref:transposase n=1 Tax=Streptomyces phaeochromogenes TaxID=1923 RepID=UPI003593D2F6
MWTWAGVIRRMPSGNDCGRSCRSATGVVAGGGITRQMIDGIPRQVWTGAQWRNLPERSGLWKTVCKQHRLWSAEGPGSAYSSRSKPRLTLRARLTGTPRSTPPSCGRTSMLLAPAPIHRRLPLKGGTHPKPGRL